MSEIPLEESAVEVMGVIELFESACRAKVAADPLTLGELRRFANPWGVTGLPFHAQRAADGTIRWFWGQPRRATDRIGVTDESTCYHESHA